MQQFTLSDIHSADYYNDLVENNWFKAGYTVDEMNTSSFKLHMEFHIEVEDYRVHLFEYELLTGSLQEMDNFYHNKVVLLLKGDIDELHKDNIHPVKGGYIAKD